ncbi:hypothetical protein FACS1894154_07480 [Betaproteobacteria bacterium]|nr:hypothetical protein FACS1894154_07480 [Betaproteobacteria bacterium]GHU30597.1 hypothetical protein FACS189497_10540 [Betaproteobacteria bacterium]
MRATGTAGPKILSDPGSEDEWLLQDLRYGLKAQGWKRHPATLSQVAAWDGKHNTRVEKRSAFHHWTDQHEQQLPQRQTDVRAQAPCGG